MVTNTYKQVGILPSFNIHKVKRVVIYARVSTSLDAQDSSYELQINELKKYVSKNADYKLVCVYADKATGTNQNRESFQTMLNLARLKGIDVIITKSISRFARNTTLTIQTVRELKALGIEVIFDKENISTLDPNNDFIFEILSSHAEEESKNISDNTKWAFEQQMKKGIFSINRLYGYIIKNGVFTIDPVESLIVREIYQKYLSGVMVKDIIKELHNRNVKSPSGSYIWHPSTIERILTNEKYVGDFICGKTHTNKVLGISRKVNTSHNRYLTREHHEGIIPKQIFEAVQQFRHKRNPYKERDIQKFNPASLYFYSINCSKHYRYKLENHKDKVVPVLFLVSQDKRHMIHYSYVESIALDCADFIVNNSKLITSSLDYSSIYNTTNYLDETDKLYHSLESLTMNEQLAIYNTISQRLNNIASLNLAKKNSKEIMSMAKSYIDNQSIETIKNLFNHFIIEDNQVVLIVSASDVDSNYDINDCVYSSQIEIIRNYEKISLPYYLIIK